MNNTKTAELTAFHAKYFAHELTRKLPANSPGKFTAALQDAQVDLNPHQVEAALFAFQSPLSKGAILADEVGLGKTIEAGIILSQMWAEHKRKLLIIVPANLRKQWYQELLDKFFLPSFIIENQSFNEEIKKSNFNPFIKSEIIICSYQFARLKEVYLKSVQWDLVVIDEAHRLRNVYKPNNKISNSIKESLIESKKILLTATPLQNSLLELFGLVSIIDLYSFGDLKSFKSKYSKVLSRDDFQDLKARLSPVCKRTLRRQVKEYINYTNRIAIVEEFYPTDAENELYDLVTDYLSSPKLYALPASQRSLMTLILRKLLASSTFAVQGTLAGLAEKLENLLAKDEEIKTDTEFQDYENYSELAEEWLEDNDTADGVHEKEIRYLTSNEILEIQQERDLLYSFSNLAKSIIKNSKGEKLLTALNKGFEKLYELGAPQKAIIFTESTRTQQYLKNILERNGYKGKLVLFNGSNTDPESKAIYNSWMNTHRGTDRITGSKTSDMRQAIVDYFKDTATIMIATEAAAEGINLQFCSLVVNYDLPWNPQRIEQRIGRCHRYGQRFDVVVVNFLNKSNEADQHVYQLLDEKFKLFSGVFGASDEILGSIESGIDFEKRIAKIYQECRKPEEIRAAFDVLRSELEQEIESNIDATRKSLLENFDTEVTSKLRVNLEQGRQYLNQYEQWLWAITRFYLKDWAEFDHSDNSFILLKNPFPGENIHSGPYLLLRSAQNKKKSEIEIAAHTNVYRTGHPLAQRIINICKNSRLQPHHLIFDYTNNPQKITALESLVGSRGWMKASLLILNSFDTEEYIILTGCTEDKTEISAEICRKLFEINAYCENHLYPNDEFTAALDHLAENEKNIILAENMKRNAAYFDQECEKLDKWADDLKISLEREIKDLDAEIKLRKAEARKISSLEEKVAEQRNIKELERRRNERRRTLFEAQDDIDNKKENLISEIESRLRQDINMETLFTIEWKLI